MSRYIDTEHYRLGYAAFVTEPSAERDIPYSINPIDHRIAWRDGWLAAKKDHVLESAQLFAMQFTRIMDEFGISHSTQEDDAYYFCISIKGVHYPFYIQNGKVILC